MRVARAGSFVVVLVVLALTGWTTRAIGDPVWRDLRASAPALQLESLEDSLGQGITLALLGGFRAVTADFLWLKTNAEWERQDLPATQKLIDLVTTIDPRPLYFWINGARIIGYDMPFWRYEAHGGYQQTPEGVRDRIDAEQAQAALDLLERALGAHPNHPLLLIEIANIHARRLRDLPTATEFYRRAALTPGAPYYAARIHAAMLVQLGRVREAYDWLRQLHPALPADDPAANPGMVLERIRELEQHLGVPESERYQPRDLGN